MKRILAFLLSFILITGPCEVVNASAEDSFSELETKLPALEELLVRCEEQGMDVSYERIDYQTIKDFIEYGRDDISWGHTERAEYVVTELEAMYEKAYSKLTAYREGTQKPMPVKRNTVRYFAGQKGGTFLDANGEPVYLNGYNDPGWTNRDFFRDIEKFQGFGADVIQIEIVPNDIMYSKDTINGWMVSKNNGVDAVVETVYADTRQGTVLRISNQSGVADNVYTNINQNINVRKNTSYVYTFKAKADSANGIYFYPNGWSDTSGRIKLSSGTYGWTEFTCSYTTGKSETDLNPMFVCNNKTTEILIDDVTLTEFGSNENIIQNGDFEDEGNVSENFRAWTAPVDNIITRILDHAEKNDIMVDVLLQPATFSRLINMYPEIAKPSSCFGYDITNDKAKEALDLYVKTVMERIKDHPALLSVCISNEPNYDTRTSQENLVYYQEYLSELYGGDINALKAAYGLGEVLKSSFSEIEFPDDTRNLKFYEWVRFNNMYTSSRNRYVAELVKQYAPEVPVHAKIMSIFGNSNSVKWGTDPEEFNEFTDFSGNDCYGFIENPTGNGLVSKLMWYDLLKSIAPNKPIINSEDHIIVDGSTNYSKNNTTHVVADIWQGALHGRDASALWIWNRSASETSTTYGNILYRPDAVALVGKRSLDLNRLSKQVNRFSEKKNYVTLLWSDTSFIYGNGNVMDTYKAALFAGANPDFITERQLISGKKPSGVLVIPGAINVRSEAFDAIKGYAQNGGTVWAIGENCLVENEKKMVNSGSVGFAKVLDINTAKAEFETLTQRIVWDENEESLENVEILSAQTGEDILVNLCSYDWSGTKTVQFSGKAINLLTNEKYKGSITISPYVPVLLWITDNWYRFDAEAEAGDYINLTANLKNESTTDAVAKIYFKVFNQEGQILNSVIYENKPVKDGTKTVVNYSYRKNEDVFKAEVGTVVDSEVMKETFFFEE